MLNLILHHPKFTVFLQSTECSVIIPFNNYYSDLLCDCSNLCHSCAFICPSSLSGRECLASLVELGNTVTLGV